MSLITGRNSTLKKYQFHYKTHQLSILSSDKLPFSWLGACHFHELSTFVVGFSGSNLIVWDHNSRRILLENKCGGGHRSWDYEIKKYLKFSFLRDKSIHTLSCDWKKLKPQDLIPGYHVNEINSIQIIPNRNSYLLISGGEDTTLRLAEIDSEGNFNKINVLKSHLSSIRTITSIKITNNLDRYLLFSAGGRAQIVTWQFDVASSSCANVLCRETHSYYEPLDKEESEMRIMNVCALNNEGTVILFCACSDGRIKIFRTLKTLEIQPVHEINYKLNCIVLVRTIKIFDRTLLISAATDGNLVFWDVTNLLDEIKDSQDYRKTEIFPIYSINCHQSAVNSFSYKILDDNRCIFLSGGDDNAISLLLLEFFKGVSLSIKVIASELDTKIHCAHITGAFITKDYFITSSVDQSVVLFRWYIENDNIYHEFCIEHTSPVADLQSMECLEYEDHFKVLIYGKGVEFLKVHKNG